jgi:hypothetical protein
MFSFYRLPSVSCGVIIVGMMSRPTRPDTGIDPETEKIILERLATFERDKETADDADVVIRRIRDELKIPQPKSM